MREADRLHERLSADGKPRERSSLIALSTAGARRLLTRSHGRPSCETAHCPCIQGFSYPAIPPFRAKEHVTRKDQRRLEILRRGHTDGAKHVAKSRAAIEDSLEALQRSDRMEVRKKPASPTFRRTRPGSRRTRENAPEPFRCVGTSLPRRPRYWHRKKGTPPTSLC
jgi:hypothetical protein